MPTPKLTLGLGILLATPLAHGQTATQSDAIVMVQGPPLTVRSGKVVYPGITIRVMQGTAAARDRRVELVPATSGIRLSGDTGTTDSMGSVSFKALTVRGAAGEVELVAVTGTARTPLPKFRLEPGAPAEIVITVQPSARTLSDSLFARHPKVRLRDSAGNLLVNEEVTVALDSSPKEADTVCLNKPQAVLFGTTRKSTGTDGQVEFDDLGLRGRCGRYRLVFKPAQADAQPSATSESITYDPERDLDRNFVEISAIRTLAGSQVPKNEWFDLRFKFRLTGPTEGHRSAPTFFALASIDLALSNRESADSVGSTQKYLTEASASLNFQFLKWRDRVTDVPERTAFTGPMLRVFNTIPYVGWQAGAMEAAGSPFEGSTLGLAVLVSLYRTPTVVEQEVIRPYDANLFVNLHLRSSKVDFFKNFTVRGGVLLPVARGVAMSSRLVIAVPLQTLSGF